MRHTFITLALLAAQGLGAETVASPDGRLSLETGLDASRLTYSIAYDGTPMILASPLGFMANTGNYTDSLRLAGSETLPVSRDYTLSRAKTSAVAYRANELRLKMENAQGNPFDVVFRISDNDVAIRYEIPRQNGGETGSMVVTAEATGFRFPDETTVFLTPQSDAMVGWKRTKPSYEEVYQFDTPMSQTSQWGHGYTFPGLFRLGDKGWVLVSETGVDRRYCGSRLSDVKEGNLYTIEYPMPEENNGNGTSVPGISLPGATPWRTLTVAPTLAPIVETTAPWDNVEPRFESDKVYKPGKGTWSWIVWQDGSINLEDQKKYIDLAAKLGFDYTLVDNWWDTNIGEKGIEELVDYARERGIELFLWYSSSGYWNDIVQGPVNRMDNPIERKKQMRWMRDLGVKGIKVDFFGGDKQETMRLYEDILSDADDHGLMVIFHGCTIPRGWEMMYPNYAGSEAVLASENLIFMQRACDDEARETALHPFVRNAIGCMEFGGCFLNDRMARGNASGNTRRTTVGHELATTILFQNPVQNFAVTPENAVPEAEGGASPIALEWLREVPTTWDETRFIDGYPGRYVALARRHGDTWWIAATNAGDSPLKLTLDLSRFVAPGAKVTSVTDHPKTLKPEADKIKVSDPAHVTITLQPGGGAVMHT